MNEPFQLVYQSAGAEVVRTFDQARVLVGRSIVCDLVFDSPHLSRKHAEIVRDADGWSVHDLGSLHGLAVNGAVATSRQLATGDRIALAADAAEPIFLVFRLEDTAATVAPRLFLSEDTGTTNIVASIDLRELAKSLSKSGRIKPAAAEAAVFEHLPQLPALALLKSAGEVLLGAREPRRNAAADGGPDRPTPARPPRSALHERSRPPASWRRGASAATRRRSQAPRGIVPFSRLRRRLRILLPTQLRGRRTLGQLPRRGPSPSAAASCRRRPASAARCWWPAWRTTLGLRPP